MNTIVPNLFRKINDVQYNRKRIELHDGDFIDLDFSEAGSKDLMLILHGLEGSSERAYAKGTVRIANQHGVDACVFNMRGCSGEPNRLITSYHSGRTDDLGLVLEWIQNNRNYANIFLVGFSLGGNILLKYLGEQGGSVPSNICSAVGISVPVDLNDSAMELSKLKNRIYLYRFLRTLKTKSLQKVRQFPESDLNEQHLLNSKDFFQYDDAYTAPVHGFGTAVNYYEKCSSKKFIPEIKIPTMLINALDDPFLGESCYPRTEAEQNKHVKLLIPERGGHVGFVESWPLSRMLWTERKIAEFMFGGKEVD